MTAPLESETQRDIMLAAPSEGCRLLRNNVGVLQDIRGQHVRYGVGGSGGSDLIGWGPGGVFVAIEVKRKGKKPTPEQLAFIEAVNNAGGIAAVCYSVEDFRAAVRTHNAAAT